MTALWPILCSKASNAHDAVPWSKQPGVYCAALLGPLGVVNERQMNDHQIRMKTVLLGFFGLALAGLFAGCESVPPGVEQGPHGTIAYDVQIESVPPGARIEANGQVVGTAPLHLKIYGDKDGTFHDFGSYYYIIRALPVATNQYVQTRVFQTGKMFTPEDHIPQRLDFDMTRPDPYPYPVQGSAVSPYPPPGYYYPPPVYYGPGVRFYFGPGHYHHHW
jgi:hypothetical protein